MMIENRERDRTHSGNIKILSQPAGVAKVLQQTLDHVQQLGIGPATQRPSDPSYRRPDDPWEAPAKAGDIRYG